MTGLFRLLKRLIITAIVLAILIVGGAVALFMTIDLDHFRPTIVARASALTGRQVTFASMERSWTGGLSMSMRRLTIADDPAFGDEPFVTVDRVSVRVRLAPLLTRTIEVASVQIDAPVIRIIKNRGGQLNVDSLISTVTQRMAGTDKTSVRATSTPAAALPLLVTAFTIEDASISYTDHSTDPRLTVRVREADLTASDISVVDGVPQARLLISDATIELSPMAKPLEDVTLEAMITPADVRLKHAGVSIGDGFVRTQGTIENYRTMPAVDLTVTLNDVAVRDVTPPALAQAPQHIEGLLSGKMAVTGRGREPDTLQQSLRGTASLRLDGGKITQLNVLRQILTKLSAIPSFSGQVLMRLPPRYQAMLDESDTHIRALRCEMAIQGPTLRIDPLDIATDSVLLRGKGTVGVDGSVQLATTLLIPPDLSEAMRRSVNELQGLMNRDGMITFPVSIGGRAPNIAVRPDMAYITQRVVVAQGQRLLDGVLDRALPGRTPPPTSAPGDASSTKPEPVERQLLRGVFDSVFGTEKPPISPTTSEQQSSPEEMLLRGIFGN